MRKIERQMIQAIRTRQNFKLANTEVCCQSDPSHAVKVYLHGSNIATLDDKNGMVWWSDCGYQTATTKSRLNAILGEFCGHYVYQHKFDWYYFSEALQREKQLERGALQWNRYKE